MLTDKDKNILKEKFKKLDNDVELVVFTQEYECQFCKDTRILITEIASLSSKLKAKVYDFVKDEKIAKQYNIKKIPAVAIIGNKDYGVRYYGIPAGYELPVIIEDILEVSKGSTSLTQNIKDKLKDIKKPVHIQVFVSPTCPYCPKAARLSHQFAIENEYIHADVIEMMEFPYLVQKYGVMSVPHVVINEYTSFIGAQPPEIFIEQIHMALRADENPMYS